MPDAHTATRRHPLHVHLTVLFSGLVLVTGALLAGLGYAGSRAIALAASETQFAGLARETGARLALALAPGARAVDLLAEHPIVAARGIDGPPRRAALARRRGRRPGLRGGLHRRPRRLVLPAAPAARCGAAHALRGARIGRLPGRCDRCRRRRSAAHLPGRRARGDRPPRARGRALRPAHPPLVPRGAAGRAAAHRDRALPLLLDRRKPASRWRGAAPAAAWWPWTSRSTISAACSPRHCPCPAPVPSCSTARGAYSPARPARRRTTDDGAGLPLLAALADPALASLEPAAPGGSATRIDDAAGRTWQRMVVPVPTAREMLSLGMAIPLDELLAPARAVRDRTLAATLAVMLVALPLTYGLSRRVSRSLQTLGCVGRRHPRLPLRRCVGGPLAGTGGRPARPGHGPHARDDPALPRS